MRIDDNVFIPNFVSLSSKIAREPTSDETLTLSPTLSPGEREFSPFSLGEKGCHLHAKRVIGGEFSPFSLGEKGWG